ncbi:hypothetical protein SAMN04487819_11664 [Actinopolyspora alba]|uniref:Tail assembly chaperone n=1 Tax=Actinopolyspora alba TaxID=673379 RepID=A0A1I2BHC8_9ACTN|nr:hypothetical protein [Actinopolyspora alba]SFE54590.1 hypothetical protein SAMN04487819_11664 [Actinopolyspora alba]
MTTTDQSAESTLLTREAILACDDEVTEIVSVPQWDGTVRVTSLTGKERDRIEAHMIGKDGKAKLDNLRARVVAASVVDEQGRRLFAETDLEALSGKNAAALDAIFTVAQRVSGMSDKDVDELTGE